MFEGFTQEDLQLALEKKQLEQANIVLIVIETALAGFCLNQQSIENIKTEIDTRLKHNYNKRGGNVSFSVYSELLFTDSSDTRIVSCISKYVPHSLVDIATIATNFANSLLRNNGSSYKIKHASPPQATGYLLIFLQKLGVFVPYYMRPKGRSIYSSWNKHNSNKRKWGYICTRNSNYQ